MVRALGDDRLIGAHKGALIGEERREFMTARIGREGNRFRAGQNENDESSCGAFSHCSGSAVENKDSEWLALVNC